MKRASWVIVGVLSTLIGLYPIIYFLIDRNFGLLSSKSEEILNQSLWNITFYAHIVFGGIALLIGWIQFNHKLRENKIKLHRTIGKTYIVSVLISGVSGLYVSVYVTGGIISKVGFFTLSIIWLITTINGFLVVKKGNIISHEKWMFYSYACCFAAVTLRIWLPILIGIIGEFMIAYRIVAWLCWLPNLLIAYVILKKRDLKTQTNFL